MSLVELIARGRERTDETVVDGETIRLRAPSDQDYQVIATHSENGASELDNVVRALRACLDTDEDLTDEDLRVLIRMSGGVMGELVQKTLRFYGVAHLAGDLSADPTAG